MSSFISSSVRRLRSRANSAAVRLPASHRSILSLRTQFQGCQGRPRPAADRSDQSASLLEDPHGTNLELRVVVASHL